MSAVVRDDNQRLAPALDVPVEFARNPPPRQRSTSDQSRTLSRAGVDHDEDSEAPPVVERVGDDVEAQALIRLLGRSGRRLGAQRTLASAAPGADSRSGSGPAQAGPARARQSEPGAAARVRLTS